MKEGRVWVGVVSKEDAASLDYSGSAAPAVSEELPDKAADVSLRLFQLLTLSSPPAFCRAG